MPVGWFSACRVVYCLYGGLVPVGWFSACRVV